MFKYIMLISHSLSDFIFQTDEIVKQKENKEIKGFIYHIGTLLVISILMIIFNFKLNIIIIKTLIKIAVIHGIIDFIKIKVSLILNEIIKKETYKEKVSIILFVLDQLLHIIVILILSKNIYLSYNYVGKLLNNIVYVGLTTSDIKIIAIIIYVSLSGAYIIPLFFNCIYSEVENYTEKLDEELKKDVIEEKFIENVRSGKWIGILERILMSIFLYLKEFEVIGLIITFKSIARYNQMDKKVFAEYYLMGTLLSVIHTIIIYKLLYIVI